MAQMIGIGIIGSPSEQAVVPDVISESKPY